MIWLYWNRWRPAILAAGLSLASVALIVIIAGSVVGTYPQAARTSGTGRTGAQARQPLPPVDPAMARRGLMLMQAATIACQTVSYRGVQMVAWWGPVGSSAYLIEVWHRSGGPEIARQTDDSDGAFDVSRPPAAANGDVAGGVLSVPGWMLSLMRLNYQIAYVGPGSAGERPAQVVAVRRRNGTLAAQFWLDAATGLPLRREIFDEVGRLVNEGAFIDLQIGDQDVIGAPAAGARPWQGQRATAGLARLRVRGWSLPPRLAGNLALVGVTQRRSASGWVIDASYSDGLSVVSIFMQRGELSGELPGWHIAAVNGHLVYSDEPDQRSLAWSADGYVYTVLADAPPETVQSVVAELPHEAHIGFWQRVSRGLKRIGSWLNPFD